MRPMYPQTLIGKADGLIANQRLLRVAQGCNAAGEPETGRSPVVGCLIVAEDSCFARNVHAVCEKGRRLRRIAAVLHSERAVDALVEHVAPVHVSLQPRVVVAIQEIEDIVALAALVVISETAVQEILAGQGAIDASLCIVRSRGALDSRLIIVSGGRREVRQRIELEQRDRLRTETSHGNYVPREGSTGRIGGGDGERIDDWCNHAQAVQHLGEIASSLRFGRHSGSGIG